MAQLTGSAEVSGQVETVIRVEASSHLIQIEKEFERLKAFVHGMLNSDGPGSRGKTMQEAAPYSAP